MKGFLCWLFGHKMQQTHVEWIKGAEDPIRHMKCSRCGKVHSYEDIPEFY